MDNIVTHSLSTIDHAGQKLVEIVPVKTVTVPPYTSTNAIFFGHDFFYVIDPGTPYDDQQQLLRRYIEHRVKQKQKFCGICLTHHHGDHTKAAEYLSTHFAVPIFAHRRAQAFLKFAHHIIDDDSVIHDDAFDLRAIYTPGHADDHVVYYAPRARILLAGDMITDRGTVLIPPEGGQLSVYLQSLDKLSRLALDAIVPAHGRVIDSHPNRFLLQAIKHRYDRISAVLGALFHHQAQDATDITHLVYHNNIPDNLMIFAQLSVESSLHWLKEHGLADNDLHVWRATEGKNDHFLLSHIKEIDERLRNT